MTGTKRISLAAWVGFWVIGLVAASAPALAEPPAATRAVRIDALPGAELPPFKSEPPADFEELVDGLRRHLDRGVLVIGEPKLPENYLPSLRGKNAGSILKEMAAFAGTPWEEHREFLLLRTAAIHRGAQGPVDNLGADPALSSALKTTITGPLYQATLALGRPRGRFLLVQGEEKGAAHPDRMNQRVVISPGGRSLRDTMQALSACLGAAWTRMDKTYVLLLAERPLSAEEKRSLETAGAQFALQDSLTRGQLALLMSEQGLPFSALTLGQRRSFSLVTAQMRQYHGVRPELMRMHRVLDSRNQPAPMVDIEVWTGTRWSRVGALPIVP